MTTFETKKLSLPEKRALLRELKRERDDKELEIMSLVDEIRADAGRPAP